MIKNSKRFVHLKEKITKKLYTVDQAIALIKELSTAKFTETIEAHIALKIDSKQANQQLRTSLIFPHGTGKSLKVAVFTEEENIQDVLTAGASIAGFTSLIDEINTGKINFDILLTTPQLMPKLAKCGKILGPKGLMPSPKSGTVTQNINNTLLEFQKGKREYRIDKFGVIHLSFGKANFELQQLKENLFALYDSIEKNKPSIIKGKFFRSFAICSTMSPSIFINLSSFK